MRTPEEIASESRSMFIIHASDGMTHIDAAERVVADAISARDKTIGELLAACKRGHASMVVGLLAEVGSPIEKELRAAIANAESAQAATARRGEG